MPKQNISVFAREENKKPTAPMPPEFREPCEQILETMWSISYNIIQDESGKVKNAAEKREDKLEQQYQAALKTIENANKEIAALKLEADNLGKDNKSLYHALQDTSTELKIAREKNVRLTEKNHQQEKEIRQLTEELGRQRERADITQKHLDETVIQYTKNHENLKKVREELVSHEQNKEHLENGIRQLQEEARHVQDKLATSQDKLRHTENEHQDLRDTLQKQTQEYKELRAELNRQKELLETEIKQRREIEQKNAKASGQIEALEHAYREAVQKLEQELNSEKSELMTLRTRLIKAENTADRESKRAERLENRLLNSASSSR